jgi:hypothetical protein
LVSLTCIGSGESFDPESFDPELTTEGLTTEGLTAEWLAASPFPAVRRRIYLLRNVKYFGIDLFF